MGALYEDVETFFGDIFAWYGRIVTRHPILLTTIPFLFCVLSGLGLINIRYETNIENLYSPINSDAQKDRSVLKSHFKPGQLPYQIVKKKNISKDRTYFDFKFHQQITYPAYFEIIIYNKKHDKALDSTYSLFLSTDLKKHFPQIPSSLSTTKYTTVATTALNKSSTILPNNWFDTPTISSIGNDFNATTSDLFYNNTFHRETKLNENKPFILSLINFDKKITENADDISYEHIANEAYDNLTAFDPISIDAVRHLYHYIATFKSIKTFNNNYEKLCANFLHWCLVDIIELKSDVGGKTTCLNEENIAGFEKFTDITIKKPSRHSKLEQLAKTTTVKPVFNKSKNVKVYSKTTTTTLPLHTSSSLQINKYDTADNVSETTNSSQNYSTQPNFLPILKISPQARALKLRFNLRGETHGQARQNHLRWQEAILDQMKLFQSPFIDISFVASDSLEIELRDHVGGDTKYFSLSVVGMMITATLAGCGGTRNHVILAYTGVIAALLAILAAFGLLSLFGTSFVNLCSVMPFLVLGIGVDDMLQLLIEWRKVSTATTQEEQLSSILRSAAVSITITSLTDLLAFCIGATSPFLSVRNFCACSGLGIFLCYVNQLTFFSGCIVLISKKSKCRHRKDNIKSQESFCLVNKNSNKNFANDTATTIVEFDVDAPTAETALLRNEAEDDFKIVTEPLNSKLQVDIPFTEREILIDPKLEMKENNRSKFNSRLSEFDNSIDVCDSDDNHVKNFSNPNLPTVTTTIQPPAEDVESPLNRDTKLSPTTTNSSLTITATTTTPSTTTATITTNVPLSVKHSPLSNLHIENKSIHRNTSGLFTTLLTDVLSSVPSSTHTKEPNSLQSTYSDDQINKSLSGLSTTTDERSSDCCLLSERCCNLRACYEKCPIPDTLKSYRSKNPSTTVGVCELFSNFFSEQYPKLLLHWIGKTTTVVVFIAYVCISINGVTKLEEGLNLEALVPPEHYYRHHAVIDSRFFPNCGIVVTFVVYHPLTYHEVKTQEKLQSFLKSVESSEFVVSGSLISWLDAYKNFYLGDKIRRKHLNASEFGRRLQTEFLPKNLQYLADITFSKRAESLWVIEASRFYVICHRTNTSENEKDLMLEMRKLASNSSLPIKAFSPHFVFYEHYASILKNTLLPVGVTVIGMLFVALVFIPHPIAVTCVIGSMASVVVGMMGFMQICDLALSAITTMQIILGVGICVSFTVKTSHAFMTATGKSRNERVTSALVKVGASILTGAACSYLSAFALYNGTSFIFASFFKTMAFALLLGVLHSIVFLPVMLSFVGPRRTGKPRLFIPTSAPTTNANVSSSENDNSNANSSNTPLLAKEKLEKKASLESSTSKNSQISQAILRPNRSSLSKFPRVSSKTFVRSDSKKEEEATTNNENKNIDDSESKDNSFKSNRQQHKVSFKLEDLNRNTNREESTELKNFGEKLDESVNQSRTETLL